MKNSLILVLLFLCPILARADGTEELLYFHCPAGGGEYNAKVTTQILLARAFLDPALSEEANIKLAALHQLRYFWGITRSDPRWPPRMQVVLSRKDPTFAIKNIVAGSYGRDLVIDWKRTEERLKIEPGYIARAVAAGRVDHNDPAIRATVDIHFDVAICAHGEEPGAELTTPLPHDPWLMHWLVPTASHRTLRYYNTVDTTTPCADNDFADLPHPYYYWYDWYPTRRGRDEKGRSFDCTRLLKPIRDYATYRIALGPKRIATRQFEKLAADLRRVTQSRPLRITAVIGVLDHEVTGLGLPGWQERIGEGTGTLGEKLKTARQAFAESPVQERGTGMLLLTLGEMVNQLDDLHYQSRLDDDYLVTELDGRFKRSGAPLHLRLVLGMTDVFGPKPPAHWRFLERGLVEDDVVLYYGHSGIGENFRLEQIGRHLSLSADAIQQALDGAPLLLVAFLSCYSYMYFGEDLLLAGKHRQAGGTFLFTGMGAVGKDRGPVPVIELVDRLLDPKQSTWVDRLPLGDEELWIIKRINQTRPNDKQ